MRGVQLILFCLPPLLGGCFIPPAPIFISGWPPLIEQQCDAARKGDAGARIAVGYHYESVKRDNTEALKWFILARDAGDNTAVHRIADISRRMPVAAVSEGEARAVAWTPESGACG